MKYIIKNCPAINDRLCKLEYDLTHCVDVSDCIIKQIIELCNDVLEQETDPLNSSEMSFARKILDLLEIEEANE